MKQYRLEKAADGYRLSPRDTPVPAPGPNEVLVRIRATSLNRRDVMVLRAQYGGARVLGVGHRVVHGGPASPDRSSSRRR